MRRAALAASALLGCGLPPSVPFSSADWHGCPAAARASDPRPISSLVIALDVSASTRLGSGYDLDGDGVAGVFPDVETKPHGRNRYEGPWSTDPEDTVIEAELRAIEALLRDPITRSAAVGLVAFSGQVDQDGIAYGVRAEDAVVAAALETDNGAALRSAIDRLRREIPRGATNYEAAIEAARAEHRRAGQAAASGRRVILLLTDGTPTLPHGRGNVVDREDLDAARRAAVAAFVDGIELHVITFVPAQAQPADLFTDDLAACVGGGHALFPAAGVEPEGLAAGLLAR